MAVIAYYFAFTNVLLANDNVLTSIVEPFVRFLQINKFNLDIQTSKIIISDAENMNTCDTDICLPISKELQKKKLQNTTLYHLTNACVKVTGSKANYNFPTKG